MKQQQGGGNELHDIFSTGEESTPKNTVSAALQADQDLKL